MVKPLQHRCPAPSSHPRSHRPPHTSPARITLRSERLEGPERGHCPRRPKACGARAHSCARVR
eukprot:4440979-Alexandrium_andersonii.AAC.1